MCRTRIETMFWRCGHVVFTQKPVPDCDCKKELLRMTVKVGAADICSKCQERVEALPSQNGPLTLPREKTFLVDWLRRLADFQKADDESMSIGPEYQIETLSLLIGASGLTTWTDRPLPMDYQPNDFLTEHCDFHSPDVKVVPPGMVPSNQDKCSLCWGFQDVGDYGVDERCSGESARMLPCGHIFGRKCIANLIQEQSAKHFGCPLCRKHFRVSLVRRYSEMPHGAASIMGIMDNNGWKGGLVVMCLFPVVSTEALTMNVAPKVNPEGDVLRNGSRIYKIKLGLLMMVISPFWCITPLVALAMEVPHIMQDLYPIITPYLPTGRTFAKASSLDFIVFLCWFYLSR